MRPLDLMEDVGVNIFKQKLDHMHLKAPQSDVKAMICCRGVINPATHLEHVYLLFCHRSKLGHQQTGSSPGENNNVAPGFYVTLPFLSSIYFLTMPSVFL